MVKIPIEQELPRVHIADNYPDIRYLYYVVFPQQGDMDLRIRALKCNSRKLDSELAKQLFK